MSFTTLTAVRRKNLCPNLPHIVIVDDDRQIRGLLCSYLQSRGFEVTAVVDGKALDRQLRSKHVDLIVLDLALPGEDGLSICKRLRTETHVPVIILSARRTELDRILGLEVGGAQDYVIKPFNPRELLARIRNVLGRWDLGVRRVTAKPERYRFAGWTLDTISRSLIDPNGRQQPLAGSEYRILEALTSQGNRLLSRNELMELTKGREADAFDRSIDVRISRLRQLLGEDARESFIIKTVYGQGYMMGVRVESE